MSFGLGPVGLGVGSPSSCFLDPPGRPVRQEEVLPREEASLPGELQVRVQEDAPEEVQRGADRRDGLGGRLQVSGAVLGGRIGIRLERTSGQEVFVSQVSQEEALVQVLARKAAAVSAKVDDRLRRGAGRGLRFPARPRLRGRGGSRVILSRVARRWRSVLSRVRLFQVRRRPGPGSRRQSSRAELSRRRPRGLQSGSPVRGRRDVSVSLIHNDFENFENTGSFFCFFFQRLSRQPPLLPGRVRRLRRLLQRRSRGRFTPTLNCFLPNVHTGL